MKDSIEKLDRLPDAALSDISIKPESFASSESSGIGVVAENEVMQGANHTQLDPLSDPYANTAQPSAPGTDKPATPSVITQATGIKQPVAIGTLFNGKAGIELVDMLFPALIVLVADNVIGYMVDKKDLQLTAAEKSTIAPFMQAYLDSVNVQMSPLGALVAVMSGVYAAKFMEAFPNIKKKSRAQQSTLSVPRVIKMQTALSETEVMNRINKTKNLQERQKQYAAFVAPMAYDAAIAHIKTTRKVSIGDAQKWYKTNVEPIKTKAK